MIFTDRPFSPRILQKYGFRYEHSKCDAHSRTYKYTQKDLRTSLSWKASNVDQVQVQVQVQVVCCVLCCCLWCCVAVCCAVVVVCGCGGMGVLLLCVMLLLLLGCVIVFSPLNLNFFLLLFV